MTEVNISDELSERIEPRLEGTDFDTVDEYAEFVLFEVVTRLERQSGRTVEPTASRDEVETRLESLGYLSK